MSGEHEVQRFAHTPYGMMPAPDGAYVRHRDVSKIIEQAEIARRRELDAVATVIDVFDPPKLGMLQSLLTCFAYQDQLRAQVEDARLVETHAIGIDVRRLP